MSSIELVGRYLAERGRPRVLGLLALLLAGAGAVISTSAFSFAAYGMSAAQAFLLILSFRVWDDVADRDRDAIEHPGRVMVLAGHRRRTFVFLGAGLALLALVPITFEPDVMRRVIALALAVTALEIWYNMRSPAPASTLGGHVVLLKYPAIAYAVAPRLSAVDGDSHSLRTAALLASLYLLICVYEYFDDPAMRASARARRIAVTELALLIPLAIAIVGLP